MFFELSKILGFLASPSNALIVLGLLGLVLMATPLSRLGRRLAGWSLVLLAIAGFSPLGHALMLPLEQRFPVWDASRGAPDGIIVLGGAIGPEVSAARNEAALAWVWPAFGPLALRLGAWACVAQTHCERAWSEWVAT